MKKKLFYAVFCVVGIMRCSAFADDGGYSLFANGEKVGSGFYSYRSSVNHKTQLARLIPEGVLLSKEMHGPGVYSVTFSVDESHEKFQYHRPFFVFNFSSEIEDVADLKLKMRNGVDYLFLEWAKSGKVDFYRHTKDGQKEQLGIWMKPGPDKDNAYGKDTFVTMHVVVPAAGDALKIYFNKAAEGVPDCQFLMPETPLEGLFGFYNPKWYSSVTVKDLRYRKL